MPMCLLLCKCLRLFQCLQSRSLCFICFMTYLVLFVLCLTLCYLSFMSYLVLFVLCLTLCYFVLVFLSPFSIAVTSVGEERANLSAFHMFVRFALVWFCLIPLPLGVWEGLRFVIVALPGLFSHLFFSLGTKQLNTFRSSRLVQINL